MKDDEWDKVDAQGKNKKERSHKGAKTQKRKRKSNEELRMRDDEWVKVDAQGKTKKSIHAKTQKRKRKSNEELRMRNDEWVKVDAQEEINRNHEDTKTQK